ncbi:hypothetical protein VNO80_15706 [Phaseolus coccineus]|uniref:Uncharacterized protein n=1 Tax=Phaseolus coccineus TaxID=3886 RepID=A0AAN9R375_PHACN
MLLERCKGAGVLALVASVGAQALTMGVKMRLLALAENESEEFVEVLEFCVVEEEQGRDTKVWGWDPRIDFAFDLIGTGIDSQCGVGVLELIFPLL